MTPLEYWNDCISESADECGAALTDDQIRCIAESVMASHENYGMAFYSPPASERIAIMEGELGASARKKQSELEASIALRDDAIKQALGLRKDDRISVQDNGVFLIDGRTTQIL